MVELRLPPPEREVLASLAGALRDSLDGEALRTNPALRRLFPPAYAEAAEQAADAEYQSIVHGELANGRRDALDVVLATTGNDVLDDGELSAWLRSVNDLRLVLGTRLDVSEDQEPPEPGHPEAALHQVYDYLGFLLEEVVAALDPYSEGGPEAS